MSTCRSLPTLGVLAAISVCVSCEGIGRGLVDVGDAGPRDTDPHGFCVLAPECKPRSAYDLEAEVPAPDRSVVDVAACGYRAVACEPNVVVIDEMEVVGYEGCSSAWPEKVTDEALFDCTSVSIWRLGDEPSPITVRGVELRRSNVSIASQAPLVVTLEDALLADVTFQLSGPVTLRVLQPRQLSGVRVLGGDAGGVEQRVELTGVDGDDLSVVGAAGPFAGAVTLSNAALRDARIAATTIDIANASIERARLDGDVLDARNSALTFAILRIGEGRLSGTIVVHAEVTECGALAIITGEIARTRIAACDEPLRVYGAALEHSFVDGRIEGDRAEFEDVVFGLYGPTDLLAWDSHVFRTNFCEHTRSVRLTASVFLVCPSCPGDSELIACADTEAVGQVTVSDCPAFVNVPECGKKVPSRPLPP